MMIPSVYMMDDVITMEVMLMCAYFEPLQFQETPCKATVGIEKNSVPFFTIHDLMC